MLSFSWFSIYKIQCVVLAHWNHQWKDLLNSIQRILRAKPGKYITTKQREIGWLLNSACASIFRSVFVAALMFFSSIFIGSFWIFNELYVHRKPWKANMFFENRRLCKMLVPDTVYQHSKVKDDWLSGACHGVIGFLLLRHVKLTFPILTNSCSSSPALS